LLEYSPNNIVFLNNLSWVDFQLGNLTNAETLATKALALSKDNPRILDTLALIKNGLGKEEEAITLLKKAMSLDPNNEEIKSHYNKLVK
jgi:Flp pilus assembly protein TadD